jgi:plasmid maintenance system killer protein
VPSTSGHAVRVVLTEPFVAQCIAAPADVQKRFGQQLAHLLRNLRHPSLRAKKYDEAPDRWQARVNDNWRFYFRIEGDTYVLLEIIPHPK